jgi:18S rRNA (adenine1779-N6/adenine1780-N6)-dimethyltransferase
MPKVIRRGGIIQPATAATNVPQMGVIGVGGAIQMNNGGGGTKKLKFGTQVLSNNLLGKSPVQKAADKAEQTAAKKKLRKAGGGAAASASALAAAGTGNSLVHNTSAFGQHFLKNPLVINAIVEKAAVKPTDVVIEVGPGDGALTHKLLETCKKVIVYEIDPRMIAELHKRFQNTPLMAKLEIVRGNFLQAKLPYFDRCVANCPYAISSGIVFKLLRHQPSFKCAVLMFQREFALRVCAPPGSELYGRLGVNAQLFARCQHLMKVNKASFQPPPKVESSVIRMDPRNPPPEVDFEEFDGLVKYLFNRSNKKACAIFKTKSTIAELHRLHDEHKSAALELEQQQQQQGNKTALAHIGKAAVKTSADTFKTFLLQTVASEPMLERRAKTMTVEEIMKLLSMFNSKGIYFS